MADGLELLVLGAGVGAALWWWKNGAVYQAQAVDVMDAAGEAWSAVEETVYETTGLDMGGGGFIQALNTRGAPYREALAQAEAANGIPSLMLARLAYQESRFRQDIISGAKVSSAGAVGIMQIVPRWHPDVNPLDPFASIAYSGRYLASLYRQFGTWELALQAYNWGPGNLRKYLNGQIGSMPVETANYSSQIMADVGYA